jgi:hypothetical protein
MDLAVHNRILQNACITAPSIAGASIDARAYLPLLVRGSWLSDMNQASLVLETVKGTPFEHKADESFKKCLRELWRHDLDAIFKGMREDSAYEDVVSKAASIVKSGSGLEIGDIGQYNRLDHLDILRPSDVSTEVSDMASGSAGRGKAIGKGIMMMVERLDDAYKQSDRFGWKAMTWLGQALHTLHDFYAHSNYVELLLWSLATPGIGVLDGSTVSVFSGPANLRQQPWDYVCPLPGADGMRPCPGAFFWYGGGPGETPLVSSVFDTSDTICSLLAKYVSHLRGIEAFSTKDEADRETYLNIAMSLFDLSSSRRFLVSTAYSLVAAVQSAIAALGKKAREIIANDLQKYGESKGGSTKDKFAAAARAVRCYSSKEADDWKKAGGYEYVVNTMQIDMLDELWTRQSGATVALPHHTLLRKDLLLDRADHALRFDLACVFAEAASVHVLRRYFSQQTTTARDWKALLDHLMRHPWTQVIERDAGDHRVLSVYISSLRGQSWPHIWEREEIVKGVFQWLT